MAISRNGWDVYESYSHPNLVTFPWITGKVRKGDHFVVLDYIARRINAEVERINKEESWGHNPRPVRGTTDIWSEHATGCAFDFNATKNGLGVAINNSFSAAQIQHIRQIIKDVQGAARWGGEWERPDGMHIELIGGNAKVKAVADLIRAGKLPAAGKIGDVAPAGKPSTPASKPSGEPTDFAKLDVDGIAGKATYEALQIVMRAIKTYSRAVDGDAGVHTWKAVQSWLQDKGYYPASKYVIDGKPGPATIKALQTFLSHKGHLNNKKWLIDGKFGPETIKALQRYLNTQKGKK